MSIRACAGGVGGHRSRITPPEFPEASRIRLDALRPIMMLPGSGPAEALIRQK